MPLKSGKVGKRKSPNQLQALALGRRKRIPLTERTFQTTQPQMSSIDNGSNKENSIPTYNNYMTNSVPIPEGRRIISVKSIVEAMEETSKHGKMCKTFHILFSGEASNGIESKLRFECNCGWSICVSSDSEKEPLLVNDGLLWGCFAAPVGYSSLKSLLTTIDIPSPSKEFYRKQQEINGELLVKTSKESMRFAALEEKRLAEEAEDFIVVSGTKYPCITVIVDGGWSKRSYGHSYNSNYGVAVIIGARTRKVLFVGTRIKYCVICSKSETKVPRVHVCYKNFDKPSTAMEADILLEGFSTSISQYGVVYTRFIGDGDSSVFARIIDVYDKIRVQKIECINHIMKNLNRRLAFIACGKVPGKPEIPKEERKMPGLEARFRRLGLAIRSAAIYHSKFGDPTKWKDLEDDIRNATNHVFGNHNSCKSYFCKRAGTEPDLTANYKTTFIWKYVNEAIDLVAKKSPSLIWNRNSNAAETFMSVVNKYIEGKRKNLGGRCLYNFRIACAVLSCNGSAFWPVDVYCLTKNASVPALWKQQQKSLSAARHRGKKHTNKRKSKGPTFRFLQSTGDKHYGHDAMEPDMPLHEIKIAIDSLQASLAVDPTRQRELEIATRGQASTPKWFTERKSRITASLAGKIFSLKDNTDNTCILRQLLGHQRPVNTKETRYGNENESNAIMAYSKLTATLVDPAGLVVSLKNGILAASPDSFVNLDGLLEVKCPYTIRDSNPTTWVKSPSPLKMLNGKIQLRSTHPHYYQVMMQIHVTARNWCDYFIWTKSGHFLQRITREETAEKWKEVEKKLTKFWREELAPELVDSRIDRGFDDYRCPASRMAARAKKADKS